VRKTGAHDFWVVNNGSENTIISGEPGYSYTQAGPPPYGYITMFIWDPSQTSNPSGITDNVNDSLAWPSKCNSDVCSQVNDMLGATAWIGSAEIPYDPKGRNSNSVAEFLGVDVGKFPVVPQSFPIPYGWYVPLGVDLP
jgi:hypothetical protein